MSGIIGPYSNYDPKDDPWLKRHLPQPVSDSSPFWKGLLAGAVGLPADVLQMTMQGRYAPLRDKVPFTSEKLGKLLGADTESSAFKTGTIGSPDPKDLLKMFAGSKLAMTLFHGTPHKFDKFDLSKIGTGEGAQAYGHGLYFAENPGVAQSYKNSVGTFAGLKSKAEAAGLSIPEYQAKVASGEIADSAGHLYEVNIPDDITAKMLDWDAPLSEQPKSVQSALREMWNKSRKSFNQLDPDADPTAGQIYDIYKKHRGGDAQAVSDELQSLGIPGIRYLDAGSRGSKEGTRNIVLFDPDAITEVKRDGELVYENKLRLNK